MQSLKIRKACGLGDFGLAALAASGAYEAREKGSAHCNPIES